MRVLAKQLLFIAVFTFSIPSYGQEPTDVSVLGLTINLEKPVYFIDTQDGDVLVPSGEYWVFPEENSLMLFGIKNGEAYTLAATSQISDDEELEPIVTSVPAPEGEPDSFYIVFTSAGGEQLISEGTFSGVRARGFLKDKAKQVANAARKSKIAQLAKREALKRERLMNAARLAQSVIDAAKLLTREGAMDRVEFLLNDIASTAIQFGPNAAKSKAKTYTPELLVLFPIGIPRGDRVELVKQAAIYMHRNKRFIKEVSNRIAKSQTIKNHIRKNAGLNFTPDEIKQITLDIMGEGSDVLKLPFVKTRGAADFTGPSIGIGASLAGTFVGGVGVGVMNALSLTSGTPFTGGINFEPRYCPWWHASLLVGPKGMATVSVELGFFQGAADDLKGITVPVNAGISVGPGVGVTVSFATRRSETATKWIPKVAGIVLSVSAGVGAGATIGVNGALTSGCIGESDRELSTR